jgi:surface polysaccharide O-acyltransferase-like enzyme
MTPWFSGDMPISRLEAAFYFLCSYSVSRIAVPIFFVITGFFLVKGYQNKGWFIKEFRKRFFSLYVPFVTWNVVGLIVVLLAGGSHDGADFILARILGFNPYVRLGCMQFWYLQTVFIYVLASPLLFIILQKRWPGLGLICLFFVGWMGTFWYYLPLPLAAGNFLWLSVGTWIGFRMHDSNFSVLSRAFVNRRSLLLAVFCIFVVCKVLFGVYRYKMAFDIVDKALVFSGVCAVFANLQMVDGISQLCRRFVGLTFFLYAVHTLMISVALRIGQSLHLPMFFMYLFKIFAAVIFSLIGGMLMRRHLPRTFNFITGGRF